MEENNYEEKIQTAGPGLCQLQQPRWRKQSEDRGVSDATVSFMTQKMTIEADDGRFDEIMKEVVSVCRKVEPDCVILL